MLTLPSAGAPQPIAIEQIWKLSRLETVRHSIVTDGKTC
jgi:hypothetical protein